MAGEQVRFGVFDLETFSKSPVISSEDISRDASVYAAGMYIKDKVNKVFYIESDLKNYLVVIQMLDEMFKPEFEGYNWYCHNFAKFDSFFIIGAIS